MRSEFGYKNGLQRFLRMDPLDIAVLARVASIMMIVAIILGWMIDHAITLSISGGILGLWVRRKWLGPPALAADDKNLVRLGLLGVSFGGFLVIIYGLAAVHMAVVGAQQTTPPDPMPSIAVGPIAVVIGTAMLAGAWYGDRKQKYSAEF